VRVLIVGGSGYLGRALCRTIADICRVRGTFFRNNIAFSGTRVHLDVRNKDAAADLLRRTAPHVIFYLAYDINDLNASVVTGTGNLLEARRIYRPASRFVYVSSDAVFDGESGPYGESHAPEPVWPYGAAKREAEIQVLAAGGTVVRTSLIYGFDPMDPRTAVLEHGLVTGNFSYPYFSDEIRCPVFVNDLCDALWEIAKGVLENKQIINVAGPEPLTRFDFAVRLARYLGHDASNIPKGRLSQHRLKRPRDLSLDIGLARRILKTKLRSPDSILPESCMKASDTCKIHVLTPAPDRPHGSRGIR